jgi:hypothetical protein
VPSTTLAPINEQNSGQTHDGYSAGGVVTPQKGLLRGGVEHSEQLAPVQPGLKVGGTFDEAHLQNGTVTAIWYRVPPWLAGTWQYQESNQIFYLDYKTKVTDVKTYTNQTNSSGFWGCERDRLGGIWDYISVPWANEMTTGNLIDKDLCSDQNCYIRFRH